MGTSEAGTDETVHANSKSRLSDLLAFVAEHPQAAALAISNDGLEWGPLPGVLRSEINPYNPSLDPATTTTLELMSPSDRSAVMLAFANCWRDGFAECNVTPADGNGPTALLLWDLRTEVGAVIAVVVPDLIVGTEPIEVQEPRPRLLIHTATEAGRTLTVDAGTHRLLGWGDDEIVGRSRIDLVHPDDQPDSITSWVEMLARPGAVARHRTRYRHRDQDRWVWFEITVTNQLEEHGHVRCEMLDITESMAAIDALHKRERLLRHLSEAMPQAILHLSSDGHVLFANDYLSTIAGHSVTPSELLALVQEDDRALLHDAYDFALKGRGSDVEVSVIRSDGTERRCQARVRSLGAEAGVLVSVEDITDRWLLNQQLERQAATDPLTGLLNRRATLEVLAQVQQEARITNTATAVAFLDLDGFKRINDVFGHHMGDHVLTVISQRLTEAVAETHTVGRLGGDEFLVICRDTDHAQAEQMTATLREAVAAAIVIDDTTMQCQTSCGVVSDMAGSMTAQAIIAAADTQMYLDKDRIDARHGTSQATPATTT